MGTLYIVATPIGNLEDITIRAIKTLLAVSVIACEDTRHTGQLIKILEERYTFLSEGNRRKFVSVRDWNEASMVETVLSELNSSDVALVSDAGTPLISDPGYKIVRAAKEAGYKIVPIPGPSAVTAALSAAGLPTNKFMFWGFLPKKWELLPEMTHVIYESPVRLEQTFIKIKERYPEAEIVIANELTKIHEKFISYPAKNGAIQKTQPQLKGEVVVLVYVPTQKVENKKLG